MSYMAVPFMQTAVGLALIPLASGAALAIAGAMIKMMLDISSLKQSVSEISRDIVEIKADADIAKRPVYSSKTRTTCKNPRRREGRQ